jgi:hypothetical protein
MFVEVRERTLANPYSSLFMKLTYSGICREEPLFVESPIHQYPRMDQASREYSRMGTDRERASWFHHRPGVPVPQIFPTLVLETARSSHLSIPLPQMPKLGPTYPPPWPGRPQLPGSSPSMSAQNSFHPRVSKVSKGRCNCLAIQKSHPLNDTPFFKGYPLPQWNGQLSSLSAKRES